MVVKRSRVVIGVALVTCLIIAALYVLRAPYPSRGEVARVRARLYESWARQTQNDYEAFKELASANGWKMFVRTNDGLYGMSGWGTSIGRLDCGHSTYTPLYTASKDRFINPVTPFREGKAAFVECTMNFPFLWGKIKRRDFELGVLHTDTTLTRVRIPAPYLNLVAGIAIGKRYVFFSEFFQRMWLYDMQKQALRRVPKPPGWEGILARLSILGDRFLPIGPDIPGLPLVVLEAGAPHAELSRIENIWKALVVGENFVVQKEDVCFLYDPESGGTERLTPGRLVVPFGKNEFLFCSPDTSYPHFCACALQRYNIVTRSADVLWEPPKGGVSGGFRMDPGEEKGYDYDKLILSPDGRFLFLPRVIPSNSKRETVLTYEYDVYDLRSGENCGSFLTIHEGKFYFEFLGWAMSEQQR